MIFLTTGHQTPFDRLVRIVDDWADEHPEVICFAQIGSGSAVPMNMKWCRWLDPEEHRSAMASADLIVAHAGTGTILQALELGKPILVLARRSNLAETRNDHQIATVRELSGKRGVFGAVEEEDFLRLLNGYEHLSGVDRLGRNASSELLQRIRGFIGQNSGSGE